MRPLTLSCLCLILGCAAAEPPPAAPLPLPTPPAVKVASPAPEVLRFPPGAPAPRLGCFAWSESLKKYACLWGHYEDEPTEGGTGLWISFVGRHRNRGLDVGHGVLHDARQRELDHLMVAGGYVATEDGPWTEPGTWLVLGSHRASMNGESLRVEHDGAPIYEHSDHHSPQFTPTCKLRALPVGSAGIILERSCRLVDEGVEVIEFDVVFCDDKHC